MCGRATHEDRSWTHGWHKVHRATAHIMDGWGLLAEQAVAWRTWQRMGNKEDRHQRGTVQALHVSKHTQTPPRRPIALSTSPCFWSLAMNSANASSPHELHHVAAKRHVNATCSRQQPPTAAGQMTVAVALSNSNECKRAQGVFPAPGQIVTSQWTAELHAACPPCVIL